MKFVHHCAMPRTVPVLVQCIAHGRAVAQYMRRYIHTRNPIHYIRDVGEIETFSCTIIWR